MKYNDYDDFFYEEETITKRNERIDTSLPPIIRKMRLLEKTINITKNYRQNLFFLQAKLMENYIDSFNYNVNKYFFYPTYYPTYDVLNNNELRSYFTWRTYVRNGDILESNLNFVFLYLYELINLIGVKNPLDGLEKFDSFVSKYKEIYPYILHYTGVWRYHYIIYYNLDKSYLGQTLLGYDNNIIKLLNIESLENEEILETLNELSTYKILNSPLYKKYKSLTIDLIPTIFKKICDTYKKSHQRSLINDYFEHYNNLYTCFFSDAIFANPYKNRTYRYDIDDIRYIKCIDGVFYMTGYNINCIKNKRLGLLLKTIDSVIRKKISFNRDIKLGINLKWIIKIINEEVDKYLKTKNTIKPIEIDLTKLTKIRDDSLITRDKLIVDEEKDEDVLNFVNNKDNIDVLDNNNTNNTNLDENEYQLIKCLLYKKDYSILTKKGLMLSILVDNINKKLYDIYNDNILIYNNDKDIEILEDYIDDLKGVIEE